LGISLHLSNTRSIIATGADDAPLDERDRAVMSFADVVGDRTAV
jgi:hypothetical protein